MRGITEVFYVNGGLGKTPAATNRKTGVLYLNIPYWQKLPYEHKLFVLLHELGHIVLDTSNEFLADSYAFEQYAKLGYSLTESVYALSKVLTLSTSEHFDRIESALQRALKYDAKNNHNQKADKALNDFFNMDTNLDGFNLKKFGKKVLTKTPLKYTPVGLLASSNRKSLGATVNRVATKTPLRYTPMGFVASKVTKAPTKRVAVTPTTAIAATNDPLNTLAAQPVQANAPATDPLLKVATQPVQPSEPIDSDEPHWSDSENEEETTDSGEEENDAINNDVTDGFNLKKGFKKVGKVFKKVGDAAAPIGDTLLRNVPGGNMIVDARKNILASNKAKNARPTQPTESAPTTQSILPIETPTKTETKDDKTTMYIVAAIIAIVVIAILFMVLTKSEK